VDEQRLVAEELPVGRLLELGQYSVTRAEIIEFARQWDPIPLHLDQEFARSTIFGDVIGSGLHTMAIFQRLAAVTLYTRWAVIAGRAVKNVRLTNPLRPDTTVRATARVESVTADNPVRAIARITGTVLEGDVALMTIEVESYVQRRR
jgi:acyl dehydratase